MYIEDLAMDQRQADPLLPPTSGTSQGGALVAAADYQNVAQLNHLRDLPFSELGDSPIPFGKAEKVANRFESAFTPNVRVTGDQNPRQRPQKQQKSAQPRQRIALKQNPRGKEVNLLQDLYHELLKKSRPHLEHVPLEQVLEQLEDGQARERFSTQYAQGQPQPGVSPEERAELEMSTLFQNFAYFQRQQRPPGPRNPEQEHVPPAPQEPRQEPVPLVPQDPGQEQVREVPDDPSRKSASVKQVPQRSPKKAAKSLKQGEPQVPQERSWREEVQGREEYPGNSGWQPFRQEELPQQKDEPAIKSWLQMGNRELQEIAEPRSKKKKQKKIVDLLTEQIQAQTSIQKSVGRKRPHEAFGEPALDLALEGTRGETQDHGAQQNELKESLPGLTQQVTRPKIVELDGRITAQTLLETLLPPKKRKYENKKQRKTLASQELSDARTPYVEPQHQRLSLPGQWSALQPEKLPGLAVEQRNPQYSVYKEMQAQPKQDKRSMPQTRRETDESVKFQTWVNEQQRNLEQLIGTTLQQPSSSQDALMRTQPPRISDMTVIDLTKDAGPY